MRSRWEQEGGSDLDAPATITERELRALRRRAGAGVVAIFMALICMGAIGWSVFAGPEGFAEIQDLKAKVLPGLADKGAESQQTQAPTSTPVPTTDSTLPPPAGADSMRPVGPSDAAPSSQQPRQPATQGSGGY